MPMIRSPHLARAQAERMATPSAANIERIIHNKLADLHSTAADDRPGEAVSGDVVA